MSKFVSWRNIHQKYTSFRKIELAFPTPCDSGDSLWLLPYHLLLNNITEYESIDLITKCFSCSIPHIVHTLLEKRFWDVSECGWMFIHSIVYLPVLSWTAEIIQLTGPLFLYLFLSPCHCPSNPPPFTPIPSPSFFLSWFSAMKLERGK